MSKIIATLAIVSLFVGFASCGTPTSQSGAFSVTYLNSTAATKVYGANSSTSGSADATWVGYNIPYTNIAFGPGTSNNTVYAYGWIAAAGMITIYRRAINATIVAFNNDTVEASYEPTDGSSAVSFGLSSATPVVLASTVGPGYLAILASNTDTSTNGYNQVYILLWSGTSATSKVVTVNQAATVTYPLGNIFYDPGSTSFFYTFFSYPPAVSGAYTFTLYVGGYNASAAATYFASGSYSVALTPATYTVTSAFSNLVIGGDNSTSATNIYVAFKDTVGFVSYYSKTPKLTTTTSVGTVTSLVADVTSSTTNLTTYYPIGVWASNLTYGIALSLYGGGGSSSGTRSYTIANWYNATGIPYDTGLLSSGTYGAIQVVGFQLNTGYTLLATINTATSGTSTVLLGSFYLNATVNSTSHAVVTLSSGIQGPFNVFEDVNGTEWIGWTDYTVVSGGTSTTLYGYLAKLQGQDNPPGSSSSFANALKGIMAFVAFCLAVVFAF